MKLTKNSNIVVHGFQDWAPELEVFMDMLDTVQIGANGDCSVTIDGETKTMKEWQSELTIVLPVKE